MLYIHCLIYYYDDSVCRCYINPPLTEKEARGVNLFKDIQLSTNPDLLILKTFFLTIMSCCSRQMNWYSDELSTFSSLPLWAIKIFFQYWYPHAFPVLLPATFLTDQVLQLTGLSSLESLSLILTSSWMLCPAAFPSWIVLESILFSTTQVPQTSPWLHHQGPPMLVTSPICTQQQQKPFKKFKCNNNILFPKKSWWPLWTLNL